MELVEILRAVAVGPPEPRMLDVQCRRVLGIEADLALVLCGASSTGCWKAMFSMTPWTTAFCGLSLTFSTVAWTATSDESVRGRGRSVVTSGFFTSTGPVAERKTFCQMPVSRSRMAGIQSQPMVERNVGPSMAVMPPLGPMPSRKVCSCGTPGWGCGETSTASTACLPGFTCAVMSKMPRMKAPGVSPTCAPLTQTVGGVVDAVEVEPDVTAFIGLWERRSACGTSRRCGTGSRESISGRLFSP